MEREILLKSIKELVGEPTTAFIVYPGLLMRSIFLARGKLLLRRKLILNPAKVIKQKKNESHNFAI